MRFRTGLAVVAAVGLGVVALHELERRRAPTKPAAPAPVASASTPDAGAYDPDVEDDDKSPILRPPTGKLASLSCAEAATIVKEVRAELAFDPTPPSPRDFAAGTKDWIDPHGHWAVSRDAAPFSAVDADSAALLAELRRGTQCPAALRIGRKLAAWVDEERGRFDARSSAARGDAHAALTEALDDSTADGGTAMTARAITDELADRAGALQHSYGAPLTKYVSIARARYFPQMTPRAWSEVVLAAAVRAWVELVDAHGAWAPYGEESAVHDVDLDEDAPSRLWTRATRTVLGVRVDDGAMAPLAAGDVLLEVDGMALAGLPIEQLDELALTAGDSGDPFDVVLLRDGDREPRVVSVDPDAPDLPVESSHPFDLDTKTVAYGSGKVAIVTIPDIYDDLGDLFSRALAKVRSPKLVGIVLDLRDDGGGSTEGAIDTLGAFLPGARLFPMRSKDGSIETDAAPSPPTDQQWTGPVATHVDAGTASAAEMLAGALAAYKRGPTVGAPTYGKGCAQEYLDDDAHAGLLRVTTLLFSLPDGSPVQHVGLKPTIPFPFVDEDVGDDREAKLPRSPGPWTGPDVRDKQWLTKTAQFAWPSAGGHVGPCADAGVCKAIALLGARARGPTASRK
jgi:carboxyl-terminal processing protease